jgi:uncharacterized damage-inducible protein DinB
MSAMTPLYFQSLAGYNAWANRRLYAVAATLLPEELSRKRPAAFFRSIIGTLNHLVVTDRIWLHRLEGCGPHHTRLDAEPFPSFSDLQAVREVEDERLDAYAAGLTQARLEADLVYRTTRGIELRQPLWQVLAHLFNHQAHHRGQAHALIREAGLEPPELDLLLYQRDVK